jgi:dihydrodipicolinate synthase/N-acetylneuraminate lyase
MSEFKGVFPALVTPFSSEDTLNEEAFRRIMEYNIQAGAHGFWVAGGAGESVLLDDEENNRISEIAAEVSNGRALTIMHVGAPTTRRAARMAEHAAKAGVDAICCVPPFFYRPDEEGVVEHYRVIGASTDLPLYIYNLPQCTGVEITLELIEKIQERVPELAGLKHSGPAFRTTRHFAKLGLSCFIGSAALLLPALTIGACGCVDGPLSLAPDLWVNIWNAYHSRDLDLAQDEQDRAAELYTIFQRAGYIASMKVLLSEKLGIDCGVPRPPGRPLTAEQKSFVIGKAGELGLL